MKTELEKLKERVKEIEKIQKNCNHEWGEAYYYPEKKEITREEFVPMGSDPYYRAVGTGLFTKVDRWYRICKKCQKKEYTYDIEDVVVKTVRKPKFK